MDNQLIYKPRINTFIVNILYVIGFVFIVVFVKSFDFEKTLTFIGLIFSFVILLLMFKSHVVKILLSKTSNELIIYIRSLFRTRSVVLNIDDLKITFKREVGARGLKQKLLKLYNDKVLIITITPGVFGWDETTLYNMLEDVKQINPNLIIED